MSRDDCRELDLRRHGSQALNQREIEFSHARSLKKKIHIHTHIHTYNTYIHTYIQYIHTYIHTYIRTYIYIHTPVRFLQSEGRVRS